MENSSLVPSGHNTQNKCFIIAEAGVNHNGSVDLALELVDVAAECGADAVKFQTFAADRLATQHAPKARYQLENQLGDTSQYNMLKRLELSESAHYALAERAQSRGLEFLSTPFDVLSLRFLVNSRLVSRIKLGSGEIGNLPLLVEAGACGLPLILSTGMSTVDEISLSLGAIYCGAIGVLRPTTDDLVSVHKNPLIQYKKAQVTLLQCTTDYPAVLDDINIAAIPHMEVQFGVKTGFSDHSDGIIAALGAVALGARIVEKHFTLSHDLEGPDHKASLVPDAMKGYVAAIRAMERALGSSHKEPGKRELANIAVARKSLVAGRAISKGETIKAEDLQVLRAGGGLSPLYFWEVVGRKAPRNFNAFEKIDFFSELNT